MDEGKIVLAWIRANGHTLSDVADRIGYSRTGLSHALHEDRISPQLSKALYDHFWLRVPPNTVSTQYLESNGGLTKGRPPGRSDKAPRQSKLDLHKEEIIALLKEGTRQSALALRYGTSNSNLHEWMKRNGLLRSQTED